MAIEVWWGSGSPYAWRVLLALEHKRLPYVGHLLEFSRQEHKAPHLLAMNPRGQVPILRCDDYVCFESLAILCFLDRRWPDPPLFGRTPEEAGTVMRVICEFQAYCEPHVMRIVEAVLETRADLHIEELTRAMHVVAGEARTIEARLSRSDWVVGEACSAVDLMIFPMLQLLLRVLSRPEARELSARFLPVETHYPALARWARRVEALPGYERTFPPHWRAPSA